MSSPGGQRSQCRGSSASRHGAPEPSLPSEPHTPPNPCVHTGYTHSRRGHQPPREARPGPLGQVQGPDRDCVPCSLRPLQGATARPGQEPEDRGMEPPTQPHPCPQLSPRPGVPTQAPDCSAGSFTETPGSMVTTKASRGLTARDWRTPERGRSPGHGGNTGAWHMCGLQPPSLLFFRRQGLTRPGMSQSEPHIARPGQRLGQGRPRDWFGAAVLGLLRRQELLSVRREPTEESRAEKAPKQQNLHFTV